MTTKTRIGNSRGTRVPKLLLDQADLPEEVELRAEPGRIVVSAARRPRAGWAAKARPMHQRGDDVLLHDSSPRPCVIVSPDELNEHLRTVIVAP
jgi:antitoxin MazE